MSDELKKLVDEYADKLMEHADSVRIFVTVHRGEDSTTCSLNSGRGNFQAQRGQIDEWIVMQRQRERNEITRQDSEAEDE